MMGNGGTFDFDLLSDLAHLPLLTTIANLQMLALDGANHE